MTKAACHESASTPIAATTKLLKGKPATKQASKDMINNQQSTCLIPEACQCARIEQHTHNKHNYCHISS
jgi:hypothetical protein